jgi:hypothetical protein
VTPVKLLSLGVTDPNLKHYRADLAATQSIFDMSQKFRRETSAPVFRRNANGREMRGVTLIYHHERKGGHIAILRSNAITEGPRLVKKVVEGVPGVVIAIPEAANIKSQHLGEVLDRERPNRVTRGRSGNDRFRPGVNHRNE